MRKDDWFARWLRWEFEWRSSHLRVYSIWLDIWRPDNRVLFAKSPTQSLDGRLLGPKIRSNEGDKSIAWWIEAGSSNLSAQSGANCNLASSVAATWTQSNPKQTLWWPQANEFEFEQVQLLLAALVLTTVSFALIFNETKTKLCFSLLLAKQNKTRIAKKTRIRNFKIENKQIQFNRIVNFPNSSFAFDSFKVRNLKL